NKKSNADQEKCYRYLENKKSINNKNNACNGDNANNINNANNIIFDYKNYNNLSTNLLGEHQVHNACVAIEALDIKKKKGYKVASNDIRDGLVSVHWPARLQVLKEDNPKIILDGGHNPQCIDAIVKELKRYKDADIVYVVSIVKDKNADLMAKELSTVSKKFVLTHIDNKRGMEEKELEDIFLRYSDDVTYRYDTKDSIEYAKEKINNDGIVCIIGSLYFAGDLLKIYKSI
ncbi:MAG: hypothetical protein MJ151_01075, partial [Lachnospiraceae bacterium]|nr:hypothetical protein [Lachnospiraceae bacterium]